MSERARRGRESGQSLTMVLVIIVIFSLLASALLGLASSTAFIQRTLGSLERGRAAADQGVDYGIDQIVEGAAAASFTETTTLSLPGTIENEVVSITVKNVTITSIIARCRFVLTDVATCTTVSLPTRNTPLLLTATASSGGVAVPFTPSWTLSPSSGATLAQGGGCATAATGICFVATSAGTYAVRVDVNNVNANVTVTVP